MRTEKIQILKDIGDMIGTADYVFMCTYNGLKVKQFSEFRRILSQHKATCRVLKNRLVRKAAEERGIKELAGLKIAGDTAFVFGKGDAGAVAKALLAFAKSHQPLAAKKGYIDGSLLSDSEVKAVSELPPLNVMRSQLLGLLQAPTRNLVTILNMKSSEIVNVLNAYKNKLEENK